MVAQRVNRQTALDIATELVQLMEPYCEIVEIAGSIRRGRADVKDIELVLVPGPQWHAFTDDLLSEGYFKKRHGWGKKSRFGIHVESGINVDLFTADRINYGAIKWLRTGPGDANTYIMTWLKRSQAPIRTEGGYWYHHDYRLRIGSEHALFRLLGFPYIEPEDRSVERYRQAANDPDRQRPDFTLFYVEEARLIETDERPPERQDRRKLTDHELEAMNQSLFRDVYHFYNARFADGMEVTDARLQRIQSFADRAGEDVSEFIAYWQQYQ